MSADRYGCIKGLQVQGQHYLDYSSSGSSHFGADFAPHDDPRFTSGINRGSLAAVATNHKMAVLLTQILQHISTALVQSLKKYNVFLFVFLFILFFWLHVTFSCYAQSITRKQDATIKYEVNTVCAHSQIECVTLTTSLPRWDSDAAQRTPVVSCCCLKSLRHNTLVNSLLLKPCPKTQSYIYVLRLKKDLKDVNDPNFPSSNIDMILYYVNRRCDYR